MRKILLLSVVSLLLGFSFHLTAQDQKEILHKLDSLYAKAQAEWEVPGIAVAIVKRW